MSRIASWVGVWINVETNIWKMRLLYQVLATRPLAEIANAETLRQLHGANTFCNSNLKKHNPVRKHLNPARFAIICAMAQKTWPSDTTRKLTDGALFRPMCFCGCHFWHL